jgi:hypothetical protein
MMKSLNPAWLAGLTDGEGCIALSVNRRGVRLFAYPAVYFGMSSKALPILQAIHQQFGGSMKMIRRHTPKHHEAVMLTIAGSDAVELLKVIRPHLMLKRRQATIALRIAAQIKGRKRFSKGMLWSIWFRAKMERWITQMHQLNKKGN